MRDIADRWEAAGKVPRDRMKELEGRIRKVEQAIRDAESEQWKRTDPEKSARADDMVSKLETALAKIQADLDDGPRRRQREEGQGARGEPRLPPGSSSTWPARPPPTSPADASSWPRTDLCASDPV